MLLLLIPLLAISDPTLDQLIASARTHNRDLAAARARLLDSRGGKRAASLDMQPRLTPSFGYTETTRSNNSPAIPRIEGSGPIADLIPRRYGLFQSSFDVSYELDLFGAQRAGVDAAQLDAVAQSEELADTLVSLTADIARHYANIRELNSRLRIARQRLDSFADSRRLLTARQSAGLSTAEDLLQLESQLASATASLPPLEASRDEAIHALALLTGKSAAELTRLIGSGEDLSPFTQPVPADIPSEVLRERPDVRKAAAQWRAATARRRSAERDWFPRFKLTSSFGGQSGDLANVLSLGSFFSNIAPQITWGGLQIQQTRNNIARQKAREQQYFAAYEQSIFRALRDVDTALATISRERERLAILEQSLTTEQRRTALARERYRAGLRDYTAVLELERAELSLSDQITQSRATLARAVITLQKALGGTNSLNKLTSAGI
jgi:outer membrane protein, multidrug efflux system